MQWVLQHIKAFTLLVTHYPQLARLTQTFPHTVGVYHMSFMSEQRRPQLTEGEEEEENKCEAIVMDGDGETGAASTASASADDDADVVFMYSLVRGVAPRSFGLNVARLAHVNEEVVQRAAEIARIMRGEEKREEAADSGPADRQQLEDGSDTLHQSRSALCHFALILIASAASCLLCARDVLLCSATSAGGASGRRGRDRLNSCHQRWSLVALRSCYSVRRRESLQPDPHDRLLNRDVSGICGGCIDGSPFDWQAPLDAQLTLE